MARVLIVEPHSDVRDLIAIAITRAGHEPVAHEDLDANVSVDAAVIEPGEWTGIAVARELRERGIGFVFVSIFPPELTALHLEPAAYLIKPFPLHALQTALAQVLEPASA